LVVVSHWALVAVGAWGSEFVADPSFEQSGNAAKDGWQGDSLVYEIDTEVSRSGKSSLRFVNSDPDRYSLFSQEIAVKPGWKVRFGVWAKTKDLQGPESGATICLEWKSATGEHLGGSYPSGIKESRDWTHIESTCRVPEDAASVTLSCYVRRHMTGTAWFDDVELERVVDPPMGVMLKAPVYRGWFTSRTPGEARVGVQLRLRDHHLQPSDVRLSLRLRDVSGTIRQETTAQSGMSNGEIEMAVPLGPLPTGVYDLEVRLTTRDGKELQTVHERLQRVPDDVRQRCTIDEHRRLLVDGKPFFPLGMYFLSVNEQELKTYAQSKFNCLMPYMSPDRQQMDMAEKCGLKVIYSMKGWYFGSHYCPKSIRSQADEEAMVRRRVREMRSHPALLAWYLNDELPQSFLPQLEAHQRWVVEEDPNHPTWAVLYQYKEIADYLHTFDVIGTDPYPIGRKPASMVADWTAETFRQVGRSRPVWQVPQAHNWAIYPAVVDPKKHHCRTPTYDEERSMAWQCICEGATGLVFFSWFNLHRNPDVPFDQQWEALKQVAAEIDGMAPVLLSVEPTPSLAAGGAAAGQPAPRWLRWTARSHDGKLWIVAANDGDGEGEVSFTLPSQPRSISVAAENRTIRPEGNTFRDAFRPLAVHIYEIALPRRYLTSSWERQIQLELKRHSIECSTTGRRQRRPHIDRPPCRPSCRRGARVSQLAERSIRPWPE